MARPVKRGLDYFPLDVDVFSDRKIKILYSRFGADGFTLYVYLLCQIFNDGYYMQVDDDLNFVVASDLKMSAEKIGLMMNFLLERSLFDSKLFRSDKVLTSAGIQRRYQQAVRSRAAKKPIEVSERFWILKKEETETFIKVRPVAGYSEKNGSYSENNANYSENKYTKESKVKESKVKESKVCIEIPCRNGAFGITEEHLTDLTHTYPDMDVEESIRKLRNYLVANPQKQGYTSSIEGYIAMWLSEDDKNGKYRKAGKAYDGTYDISEYESYSVSDGEWQE